jgi:hypothetical protein
VIERQACQAASQPRATQRRLPRPVITPEELLRKRLREIPGSGRGGASGGLE